MKIELKQGKDVDQMVDMLDHPQPGFQQENMDALLQADRDDDYIPEEENLIAEDVLMEEPLSQESEEGSSSVDLLKVDDAQRLIDQLNQIHSHNASIKKDVVNLILETARTYDKREACVSVDASDAPFLKNYLNEQGLSVREEGNEIVISW